MDKFIKDINKCLKEKGYCLDDLLSGKLERDAERTMYKRLDDELLHTLKDKILPHGDIRTLITYIHKHKDHINIRTLTESTALIQVYSHNPDTEWPIYGPSLTISKEEYEIINAYNTLLKL